MSNCIGEKIIYFVKYTCYNSDEEICYFIDKKNALKFAYKKSYLAFLRKQVIDNGDEYNEINDDYWLEEYVDNQEHITIVAKKWSQSKDEGFGDIYSSFDITNSNSVHQNSCINNLRNKKHIIICFGMPEKYSVIGECFYGCCHTIRWKYHIEYNFIPYKSYDEFDGSYIDVENDSYVILGEKYGEFSEDFEFFDIAKIQ
jgi:hypothetical protein